jgi:hypothetical protein
MRAAGRSAGLPERSEAGIGKSELAARIQTGLVKAQGSGPDFRHQKGAAIMGCNLRQMVEGA